VLNVGGAGIGDTMQLGRRRPARSAMHHSCHVAHAATVCDKLQKFTGSRKKQKLLKNTKQRWRCGCFVKNKLSTNHTQQNFKSMRFFSWCYKSAYLVPRQMRKLRLVPVQAGHIF
jgi:hypothetical protein